MFKNFQCNSVGMQVVLNTSEWISSRARVKGLQKIMCCLLQVRTSSPMTDNPFMLLMFRILELFHKKRKHVDFNLLYGSVKFL